MIEHTGLHVSQPAKSRRFYERALKPLGYALSKKLGKSSGFKQNGRHDFWLSAGEVGTPGHVAFHAFERAEVDAFYAAAMKAGAKDNGKPGPREDYGYAAFVLDPDGHNIEAVFFDEAIDKQARRKRRAKKTRH